MLLPDDTAHTFDVSYIYIYIYTYICVCAGADIWYRETKCLWWCSATYHVLVKFASKAPESFAFIGSLPRRKYQHSYNYWDLVMTYGDIDLLQHRHSSIFVQALTYFNTFRPRQNGRHFADDTFIRIFMNENVRISINISLKFVTKGLINNIPALVQIMAWRLPGDKLIYEPMMVRLPTHVCVTRPQWVKRCFVAFTC